MLVFNWVVIMLLGFEIVYIAIQANRGQLSHFNVSTPFYNLMYALMGLAALVVTFATAYLGVLFFTQNFPELPEYYVLAIRMADKVFRF